ncbi:hypothetical protein YerA41_044 [Yersinia phage YerA41]|jgi:hypothetical protein|uniref:Uncharacterized protein n=1 Tax=Yersinia phage vB_Yru_GN1 TaxID=3074381 RepID=A0AA86IWM6_9CAUD|nr:hypothetical protein YerA41_044 [Yersinia phage YerA41]BES79860.1 hypothetical protein [Yersinia phage vB_Yru_GN1]
MISLHIYKEEILPVKLITELLKDHQEFIIQVDVESTINDSTINKSIVIDRRVSHYAGYKPAPVITLFFTDEDNDECLIIDPEYFPVEYSDKALEAFLMRIDNPQLRLSGLSRSLNDFLIPEDDE